MRDFGDFVEYVRTAPPREQQQIALEFGIVAASFIPGAGDAIGLGADLAGLRHEENRNATYLVLTLARTLPFVPPFNRIRKIKRLIREGANKFRRKSRAKPMSAPTARVNDVNAINKDMDPYLLRVQVDELGGEIVDKTINGLGGILNASRQAIVNGLRHIGLPPERIAKLITEAASAAFIEMAGQALANANVIIESGKAEFDTSNIGYEAIAGAASGTIGTADLKKLEQFAWELFNAGTMEILKSLYGERKKSLSQQLTDGQWAVLEAAVNIGTTAAARTAFDRLSNRAPRLHFAIPVMKHGAAAGTSVAIITAIRIARNAGQYEASDLGSITVETASEVVQDLYGGRR